jgi:hypothetical protein
MILRFRHLLFYSILLFPLCASAQTPTQPDTSDYGYENPSDSLFPGYESASQIIDYYKTEGVSTEDRYRFEVIVIDSLVSLTFRSPESENFHYVDYQKERLLSNDERSQLGQALASAKLTQTKSGIPSAKFSGYGQEVLIIRSSAFNITGGVAWSAISDNADSTEADRNMTTSIGGNYDPFFSYLRSHLFPDLNALMNEATARD